MEAYRHDSVDITPTEAASQGVQPASLGVTQLHRWVCSITRALGKDWRTHKYVPFALLLVLLTTLVVVAYYLNHPRAEPLADTISYLYVVHLINPRLCKFWSIFPRTGHNAVLGDIPSERITSTSAKHMVSGMSLVLWYVCL